MLAEIYCLISTDELKEEVVHIHFSQFFNALQHWRFKFYHCVEAFWFISRPAY